MADITQSVRGLAYYTEPYEQYSSLYALCDRDVFQYDFEQGIFKVGPIYTFGPNNFPYAFVQWYNKLYVSKKNSGLVKLQSKKATVVENAPGGRYMIIANGHLMLGNVSSKSSAYPNRLQWSDLYAPESFEISSSSEADYYELDPDFGEITGLTAQRSNQVIYTPDSLVVGSYNPLPTGFRFQTLYTGVGNTIHGAVVRVKDRDFFLGHDNFYSLDGFQLGQIGDEIFNDFTAMNASNTAQSCLMTLVNLRRNEVMWIFDRVDGKKWSIVYNFKEGKWSERDPQNILCGLLLKMPIRGFKVIDDFSDIIASMSTKLIDGDWQFPASSLTEFYGADNGRILVPSKKFGKADGTPIVCSAESQELFAESLFKVKEFDKLKILYTGAGLPDLRVSIGSRKHRNEKVVWSADLKKEEQIPGEATFHFHREAVGHLVRFKFSWNNTDADYISELTHISFDKLQDVPDVDKPEK